MQNLTFFGCTLLFVALSATSSRYEESADTIVLTFPDSQHTAKMHVTQLAFSEDGQRLIAHATSRVIIWDLATQRSVFDLSIGSNSLLHADSGAVFAVSRDRGQLEFYDSITGKTRGRGQRPKASVAVFHTALSPDGNLLAELVNDSREVSALRPLKGQHTAVGPDTVVLSAAHTGAIRWRHAANPQVVAGAADPSAAAPARDPKRAADGQVAFSPDGKMVAAIVADGTITAWDVASGAERGRFNVGPFIIANFPPLQLLQWLGDGNRLAVAIAHPKGYPLIDVVKGEMTFLAWRPDKPAPPPPAQQSQVRPRGARGGRFPKPSMPIRPGAPPALNSPMSSSEIPIAFAPDGVHAAVAAVINGDAEPSHQTTRLALADVPRGTRLGDVAATESAMTVIAFSPDSKWVAWGNVSGEVHVISVKHLEDQARNNQPTDAPPKPPADSTLVPNPEFASWKECNVGAHVEYDVRLRQGSKTWSGTSTTALARRGRGGNNLWEDVNIDVVSGGPSPTKTTGGLQPLSSRQVKRQIPVAEIPQAPYFALTAFGGDITESGKESLTIQGVTYACTVYRFSGYSGDRAPARGSPPYMTGTFWLCLEVPGLVVKTVGTVGIDVHLERVLKKIAR